MSVFPTPGVRLSKSRRPGEIQSCNGPACASPAQAIPWHRQFGRWLALLLVVCCTLTPWLQQLHASKHLVTPVEEISCQICQHGSLTDALASPQLIAAVSLLLYVLLVTGSLSYLSCRCFTAFSSRAPPLTTCF